MSFLCLLFIGVAVALPQGPQGWDRGTGMEYLFLTETTTPQGNSKGYPLPKGTPPPTVRPTPPPTTAPTPPPCPNYQALVGAPPGMATPPPSEKGYQPPRCPPPPTTTTRRPTTTRRTTTTHRTTTRRTTTTTRPTPPPCYTTTPTPPPCYQTTPPPCPLQTTTTTTTTARPCYQTTLPPCQTTPLPIIQTTQHSKGYPHPVRSESSASSQPQNSRTARTLARVHNRNSEYRLRGSNAVPVHTRHSAPPIGSEGNFDDQSWTSGEEGSYFGELPPPQGVNTLSEMRENQLRHYNTFNLGEGGNGATYTSPGGEGGNAAEYTSSGDHGYLTARQPERFERRSLRQDVLFQARRQSQNIPRRLISLPHSYGRGGSDKRGLSTALAVLLKNSSQANRRTPVMSRTLSEAARNIPEEVVLHTRSFNAPA